MATGRYARDVEEHLEAVRAFFSRHEDDVEAAAVAMAEALKRGGKVLFFGNGGSAADAQHLAAELINRMGAERPAMAAIALTTDTSTLTSIANDYTYDRVFSRQIEALGATGDVAYAISTSGESPSILQGLRAAHDRGMLTVALLGRDGGPAKALADHPLVVPSRFTARIQEVHALAGHILCERVEAILYPDALAQSR
jgi:D-sedoheptulose 7-phosphate isomerase